MTLTQDLVRIAVAGAGLIGKRHIEELVASPAATFCAIVDPAPSAADLAAQHNVPLYPTIAALLATSKPKGIILATPNTLHAAQGLECIAAGVPVIIEKPLASTVDQARRLVKACHDTGVPVLTGHHRNYSSIAARSREIVQSGILGRITAITGSALFYKPDDYFDVKGGWRRLPGGGPILINMTHEVNNLLSLVGDITHVQAMSSNAARNFQVEDTTAIVLRFANGALGTFLLSDAAASAKSWEQTSGENKGFAAYPDEDCYHLAGTQGSLSIPTMRLKVYGHDEQKGWWTRFSEVRQEELEVVDPLARQILHFADVIRGKAEPVCSVTDGLKTMLVVEAVAEAARTGGIVTIEY